jgi:hypothetical protein
MDLSSLILASGKCCGSAVLLFCSLLSRFSDFSLAVLPFILDSNGHTYYHKVPMVFRICLLCMYLPGCFVGALGSCRKASTMLEWELGARVKSDTPKTR